MRNKRCVCCSHPERAELDRCLRQGAPASECAVAFHLPSADAVTRHFKNHVQQKGALSPAELVHQIATQCGSLASAAASSGDVRSSIDAIKSQLSAVEFALRLEEQAKAEAATKAESSAPTMADFDRLIADTVKNYDRCPTCGAHTIYKASKPEPEPKNPGPELAHPLHVVS